MGRREGHPGMGQMADVASGREDGSREDRRRVWGAWSGGNGEEGWGPELAGSEGEGRLRIRLALA